MLQFSARITAQKSAYICTKCVLNQYIRGSGRRKFHESINIRQVQQSVLDLLEERGYVNQIAGDRKTLARILGTKSVGFYAGIDPTAPSLHLGHLLPLMVLFWLYRNGHHVVSLVGGATSKVGDPSGRLTSRADTAEAVLEANFRSMYEQVGQLWGNALRYGQKYKTAHEKEGRLDLLNNAEWLDNLNILGFLKTLGNGMRLGALLGRDTVKNKMEKGDGMSFSEFTYPLLQAWDWWHMYKEKGIQVQIGGSDQYGNIIAGIDAVKYIAQSKSQSQKAWLDSDHKLKEELLPMGLTVPLLTTASGEKFGKSAGNAIWLDRELTSSFDLYGFLLRSADDDVERYLKLFTFVPMANITSVMDEHKADPGKRRAQHLLATEVLELVHGPEEAARTQAKHQSMRAPTLSTLFRPPTGADQQGVSAETNLTPEHVKLPRSLVYDTTFARIFYHAGIVASRSEGTQLIKKGGAYAALASPGSSQDHDNGVKFIQIQANQPSNAEDFVKNGVLVLRRGKWKVRVVELVDDDDFEASGIGAPGWEEWKAASADK